MTPSGATLRPSSRSCRTKICSFFLTQHNYSYSYSVRSSSTDKTLVSPTSQREVTAPKVADPNLPTKPRHVKPKA